MRNAPTRELSVQDFALGPGLCDHTMIRGLKTPNELFAHRLLNTAILELLVVRVHVPTFTSKTVYNPAWFIKNQMTF